MGYVTYEQDGYVGIITINRPEALNALNTQVLEDLDKVIDGISLNDTRAVIVTGAGSKSFVAGADIAAMSNMTVQEGREFGKFGNDIFRKLEILPIPTIAAVNGFALGGGNELAMSCDIRYCSENAVFGQPEVGLGITPGFGGTQRLIRLVGIGKAKEMIYSAKNIKADEAYRIGLGERRMHPGRADADGDEAGKADCRQRSDRREKLQDGDDRGIPRRSGSRSLHRRKIFLRVL